MGSRCGKAEAQPCHSSYCITSAGKTEAKSLSGVFVNENIADAGATSGKEFDPRGMGQVNNRPRDQRVDRQRYLASC